MSLAWHVHHEVLLEPLTEPLENRIAYIKEHKPKYEIQLRLSLLKLVQHPEKLPVEWQEACQKREEADQKRQEAYQKRQEADQKRQEAYQKYKSEIEALHKIECPDCPWNGHTIFAGDNK